MSGPVGPGEHAVDADEPPEEHAEHDQPDQERPEHVETVHTDEPADQDAEEHPHSAA